MDMIFEYCYRSEADIINEILHRIRQEINPNTLDIAKHPVGLESRVEDIKKLLRTESTEKGGITKIGIYGMRGVGKTTLAKSLYNHLIKESFKASCFLADVRGYSEENLKLLQKQLINDIVKSNKVSEVSSVHHGMKLIEDMIRLTKVLVVIDDLDQQIQFDSLVRKFASGSVVIITTTDEELLRKIIVEPTHRYKVNELKGAEEVTLFNLHAFGDAEPSKELVKLSQDVLPHADGLPLALAVFGSHLFNKSEEGWNAFIKQLKVYPVHDVNKKLVISYDALKLVDPMLQDFFLDIACFFIGWEKERVVKIMETFYNSSNYYIEVLKQRCLLTINNKNQLGMHDLIVMMGKDIVRNISHKEPEKHSRLWMSVEIWNVLEKKKGTKEIEGIIPSNFYEKEALEGVSLATDTFKMMSKLRFLYLKSVNLTGSFEQTLEDVRWLHWDWCPLQCFPSDFKPEKLAILELPHSKMRTIWEPNMVPKAFETLTTIDMSYSLDLTATPDFTKLPCLVTLNFKGCESLEKIHIPDGSLGKLIVLNLRGCVKLKSLSDNISKLRALKSLNIGGCNSLTGSPTELNAWGQPVLKLPTSIGLLSKSVELNTSDNEYLDTPLTSPATRWDIFLSFRGIDTRYSFTDHLCHGLDAAGIRTFRDDLELSKGDLILQTFPRAIEESKICVVILSENYAFSEWCLEELVTILDCHYRHGRKVIPVFYHIDPSVVRYQSGSFGEALAIHENRFDKEKVDKWRLALREVAKFFGYLVSEASTEPEIIQDILLRAKPKTLEDVAKYPIGLETRVKGIINVLNMSSGTEGVTRIGIYGMGGVGKTTLAKALYNRLLLLGSFEDSCFLENVREVLQSTGEGLISLQQKLINDVLKNRKKITIHSVDQGIEIMRDRMSYRKVLVVVDDLDNYNNYYSLVGPLIGSGSVVIITTRDQGILNKLQVDPRYQFLVKELNDAESVALFARHAFENVSDRLLSKSVELHTSGNKFFDTAPSTTQWDVFLSFHAKDTRYSFTDHLYHGLDAAGIRTFKDDFVLSKGDLILQTITQAIEESTVFIIILSENYASSAWCLEELVTILDCHHRHGRVVLPVFYHIDPSVVRFQTRSFGEAFTRHEIRFDKDKVDKWRLALNKVANFAGGYHVTPKHRQSEIIQDIVLRAKPKTLEDVDKYPVGLETRIKGILDLLNMSGTEGVTRIGIYGMGGVGKTTLAITLYNKLLLGSGFQDSCFLSNVREVSRTSKGLLSLQQQLINDVLKQKNNIMIDNVHQGIEIMRDRLSYRKVLVVVDDLDEYDQYYSLAGPLIGSGSIVIITTRDQDILNKLEVDPRYQILVKELNDAKSVALLDQHAFPIGEWKKSLLEAYSQDILKLAGGLPLALAVYGSLLFARSGDEWKAYIERLQQIPEPKIQLTLKTSFVALECLDPDLQNIFLDIACFFVGRKRKEVVMIMESYYSYVGMHIESLKERCLLTINTKDELGMHNLLQMMGREIVRNNCHEEPEKHSRLWSSNNICDVLKQKKGTADIEGIVYSNFDNQDALKRLSFTMDTFNRMRKLRFLHIKYVKLTGKFENKLKRLTWLCWDFCPLKILPSDFYLQKLVILELPHSKLRRMWKLDTVSQVFGSLKTLNMKYSQELLATPDFKNFPNLETLNLEGCQSLLEIHISIGTLTRLVALDMGSCRELKCLPDSICDLSTLQVLNIDNCSSLEALPTELGSIESLTHLNANSLTVSELPDSIGRLSKLVELTLGYNKQLETLPETICNLRALEVLDIGGCSRLEELPDELGNIKSLQKLNANALSVLELPDSIGHLSKLVEMQLRDNKELETLPDSIDSLRSLENLDLRYCRKLSYIPKLPPNLKWIRVDGCNSLDTLSEVSDLKQLEYLYLADCSKLTKIQGLADLASLTELHLGGCDSSFLEDTLTEQFFQRQIYSGFGQQTKIYIPTADFPKWITRSSNGESSLNGIDSTLSLDLPANVSHNFLGMIIGFTHLGVNPPDETTYSIKNTTSGFTWSGNVVSNYHEAQMMIIPTSIFSVKDGDDRIEITANAEILGIHLLYKPKITMIDDYDRSHQSEDLEFEEEKSLYHSEDLEIEEEQSYHSADLEIEEVRSYHSEDLGIKPESPSPVFTLYRWIIFTLRKWLNI